MIYYTMYIACNRLINIQDKIIDNKLPTKPNAVT